MKSQLTKQIITEQVEHIADKVIKSGIHLADNCDFMIIPEFYFPPNWHSIPGIVKGTAQILVHFPDDFPMSAPIGFYIESKVKSSPNGHLFNSIGHGAARQYTDSGYWKWYCAYIEAGAWQPAAYTHPKSWLAGDNLFHFFVLIQEVLISKN